MSIVELISVIAVSNPNKIGKWRLIKILSPVLVRGGTRRPGRQRQVLLARVPALFAAVASPGQPKNQALPQNGLRRLRGTVSHGLYLCCCRPPASLPA